jgi:hypothetical protein
VDEVKITKSSIFHTSKTKTTSQTMSDFAQESPKNS